MVLIRTYRTYYMNTLQSIDEETHGPVLVTLNPPYEPDPSLVAGEWAYDHPLYTEKVRLPLFILVGRRRDKQETDHSSSSTECRFSSSTSDNSEQARYHSLRCMDEVRFRESPCSLSFPASRSTKTSFKTLARGRVLFWYENRS